MDGFNDHNFLPLFIDKYRDLPCLWQIKHPHYNHKQKRQAALEKLLELEDLSQEEAVECGTQEEAVECGSQEEAGDSGSQEEVGLSGSQ
ncbi:hypothetical protein AB205_0188350 [Aquarana catesbeiana]|uniref:MADF domain-containing protein n=1 Tax=Aquarana catesbeiana TaxID=8400 RepID=A0A2G9RD40_AQUCT|nr:hypothetical protein AB205_0188350 [Aquarana catesbeiana]